VFVVWIGVGGVSILLGEMSSADLIASQHRLDLEGPSIRSSLLFRRPPLRSRTLWSDGKAKQSAKFKQY